MPLITRFFIKTGLLFFLIALLVAVASQSKVLNFDGITPLFWHALMVGWITQIIMGVSMWMFPGRIKEENIKNQKWSWLTYGFLNVGLGLRFISEPFVHSSNTEFWKIVLVTSAILQFMAVVFYVREIWPRVMSKDQRRKKRKAGA